MQQDKTVIPTTLHLFSFGFKYGMPQKANYIFDVRNLPNPYWEQNLQACTGKDKKVIDYLFEHPVVKDMLTDIAAFLRKWCARQQQMPEPIDIGIGCTGGQHRSVFMVEQLHNRLADEFQSITLTHRELAK